MGAASSQCLMGETPMGLMPTIKKIGFEIAVLLLIFGYSAHYYFEVAALPSRKINLLLIQPVFFCHSVCHHRTDFYKNKRGAEVFSTT